MKILIITDYSSLNGGIETNALELKNYFISQGHECVIFTSSAKENYEKISDYQTVGTTSFIRTYLQCFNPFAYFDLKKLLNSFQPDVIHLKLFLTQLSPSILSLLKPYKTILHIEMYREICYSGIKLLPNNQICTHEKGKICVQNKCIKPYQYPFLSFQNKWFEKYKNSFHKVVCNSNFLKSELEKNGFKNVETIWLGIPNQQFESNHKINNKISFVGRLVHEKGVHLLLNAFAEVFNSVPDLKLEIIGEGSEKANLISLCKKLHIENKVSFKGYIPPYELDQHLLNTDLQIVPSIWNEPFGMIIIEALKRGTPILTTKMGGMQELTTDEITGLLAEPTHKSIAQKIIYFYQNPLLKRVLSDHGKQHFEINFTTEIMGQKFLKIYNS